MTNDLDQFEAAVKKYWTMEFSKTRFPTQMFDGFLMLTRAREEEQSPACIAHLLHAYLIHLRQIRK